jgi:hypothetical protein
MISVAFRRKTRTSQQRKKKFRGKKKTSGGFARYFRTLRRVFRPSIPLFFPLFSFFSRAKPSIVFALAEFDLKGSPLVLCLSRAVEIVGKRLRLGEGRCGLARSFSLAFPFVVSAVC